MKKQAGFTLIELVIVIVILGILAVTAAPKFLNLQGDANKAAAEGVAAAVKSGAQLVYSRAVIDGKETLDAAAGNTVSMADGTVAIKFGYPTAASGGINNAVSLDGGWEMGASAGVFTNTSQANSCTVTYTEASDKGKVFDVVTSCPDR